MIVQAAVGLALLSANPDVSVVEVEYLGARRATRASGFFAGPGGLVATALHAVTGSAPDDVPVRVVVRTADGREHRVDRILAMSPAEDLCLLRVRHENRSWLEPVGEIEVGTAVVVPSRPGRRKAVDLATRIVGTRVDEMGGVRLRVADPLRGRSGAPAVDERGRVVGIVSTTRELVPAGALRRLAARPCPVSMSEAHAAVASSAWGLVDFAWHAWRRGDEAGALGFLDAAVAASPPLAAAHNMLGVLHRRAGRAAEAAAAYREALRILPAYGPALHNLALLEEDAPEGIEAAGPRRRSAPVVATGGGGSAPHLAVIPLSRPSALPDLLLAVFALVPLPGSYVAAGLIRARRIRRALR